LNTTIFITSNWR